MVGSLSSREFMKMVGEPGQWNVMGESELAAREL
jgi:hypothetical protein